MKTFQQLALLATSAAPLLLQNPGNAAIFEITGDFVDIPGNKVGDFRFVIDEVNLTQTLFSADSSVTLADEPWYGYSVLEADANARGVIGNLTNILSFDPVANSSKNAEFWVENPIGLNTELFLVTFNFPPASPSVFNIGSTTETGPEGFFFVNSGTAVNFEQPSLGSSLRVSNVIVSEVQVPEVSSTTALIGFAGVLIGYLKKKKS